MPESMTNGSSAERAFATAARSRERSPEDLRLALRAATLYFLDGLTQAEVAARLGVSRPTAGRLIARAKSDGLVRIHVVVPPDFRDDLHAREERELERRFGLTEAVVAGRGVDVDISRGPTAFASVGRAAAALLTRRLSPTDTMGFTWGPEQVAVATALAPGVAACRAVVQLDGAMSTVNYQTGADYILGRMRRRATGRGHPAACAPLRGPVDGGVFAPGLRHVPHVAGGSPRGADALRRRCRLDVHHVVRGQLPGHQHARRADGIGGGGRNWRAVLRRRRRCLWRPNWCRG